MKLSDLWAQSFFYAMNDQRYSDADRCTSFADGVCDHFENKFGSEITDMDKKEVKEPTFTVENPPTFDNLLEGCDFESGEIILDVSGEEAELNFTIGQHPTYTFHFPVKNVSDAKTWYISNGKLLMQEVMDSIYSNTEILLDK